MLNDYGPYRLPVVRWADIKTFAAAVDLGDGIHVIENQSGPSIHLMVQGNPFSRAMDVLPIFLSAAVVGRREKSGPFFSGRGVTQRLNLPWIAISDPTLDLGSGIDLGWYTGAAASGIQVLILEILRDLQRRAGAELLLIGGSGGGFAALHFATQLGNRSSAFVWNPQTSILKYAPKAVSAYLATVAGETTADLFESGDRIAVSAALEAGGIENDLNDADPSSPRRLFYLQNSSDWHLQAHAKPYILGQGFSHRGRGYYTNGVGHSLVVSNFGAGHAMPSDSLVDSTITLLLDPKCSSRQVFNELVETTLINQSDAGTIPRDLTSESASIVEQMTLKIFIQDGATRVVLDQGSIRPGEGGLSVSFHYYAKDRRLLGSSRSAALDHLCSQSGVESVTARIQDGFGNFIATVEGTVISPAQPKNRIFIYGSCVSRDAFELDHDFQLVSYFARSSVGSAFSDPIPKMLGMDLSQNPSAFQQRVVAADLEKTLKQALQTTAFDLLLVDFIDERLSLVEHDARYVTHSPELARCGFEAGSGRIIETGSDEHYAAFIKGWDRLIDTVPAEQIVVSRVYWAKADGVLSTGTSLAQTEKANAHLRRLYDHVAKTDGVRFIDYSDRLFAMNPSHKWGASPFHFSDDLYRHTLVQLGRVLTDADTTAGTTTQPRMRIVSETIFCDYERDPAIVARFAERYILTLRSIAALRIPGDIELVAVTYISQEKIDQKRMFEAFIGSLSAEVRRRFLVVEYEHPKDGYRQRGPHHADLEKNPNKHAPLRDRLFDSAWRQIDTEAPEYLVRIAVDDDDLWHPGHIEEVARIASAAIEESPQLVTGVGMQNCELAYVSPASIDVHQVRISRVLTGNKFYVGSIDLLPRMMRCSPWSLPEKFDVNTAERFRSSDIELLLTRDNLATWTYMRWGDNLSVQRKDAYYEEVLSATKFGTIAELLDAVIDRPRAATQCAPPRFSLQPRALEVWAQRQESGSIKAHTNAADFDGDGLRLRYTAIRDGEAVTTLSTPLLEELELTPSPALPVFIKAVLYRNDVALSVGSTRNAV